MRLNRYNRRRNRIKLLLTLAAVVLMAFVINEIIGATMPKAQKKPVYSSNGDFVITEHMHWVENTPEYSMQHITGVIKNKGVEAKNAKVQVIIKDLKGNEITSHVIWVADYDILPGKTHEFSDLLYLDRSFADKILKVDFKILQTGPSPVHFRIFYDSARKKFIKKR